MQKSNSYFELPKGSRISFPLFCDSLGTYLLKIEISGYYSGKVKIPLLIHSVYSRDSLIYYSMNSDNFVYDDYYLKGENVVLYAFINPLFFFPDRAGKIQFIYLSDLENLPQINISQKNDSLNFFIKIPYLVELIEKNKNNYLNLAENYITRLNKEISAWDDIYQIIKMHNSDNRINIRSIRQLEMFYKKSYNNKIFKENINKSENIAFLLIALDNMEYFNFLTFP